MHPDFYLGAAFGIVLTVALLAFEHHVWRWLDRREIRHALRGYDPDEIARAVEERRRWH